MRAGLVGTDFHFEIVVQTPAGTPSPTLAVAACRAGALGLLNLEFTDDRILALAAAKEIAEHGRGPFGILLSDGADELLEAVLAEAPPTLHVVAVACSDP